MVSSWAYVCSQKTKEGGEATKKKRPDQVHWLQWGTPEICPSWLAYTLVASDHVKNLGIAPDAVLHLKMGVFNGQILYNKGGN